MSMLNYCTRLMKIYKNLIIIEKKIQIMRSFMLQQKYCIDGNYFIPTSEV